MKKRLKQSGYMIVFFAMMNMQTGCAAISNAEFCAVYQPVYTSELDTKETLLQTDRNNAVWLELCPSL